MKPQIKFIIKIWSICFILSLANVLVQRFTYNSELILITRLGGSVLFIWLYLFTRKKVQQQEKMIKDSDGFLQRPFDPSILLLTLKLIIIGWTSFIVMDYFGINPVDWFLVFALGVVIFPIASGMIPLWIKDNRWKK